MEPTLKNHRTSPDESATHLGSRIRFFYKPLKSLLRELAYLIEEGLFHPLEIETGFPLHVSLKFRRDVFHSINMEKLTG